MNRFWKLWPIPSKIKKNPTDAFWKYWVGTKTRTQETYEPDQKLFASGEVRKC